MNPLVDKITEYLSSGGLFNPEAMEHVKVRDLLIECRDAMQAQHQQQQMQKLEKMWADPRFQILADLDHLFHGSRIWGGMRWEYHPIHPAKYQPMSQRVRAELSKLNQEYGIEE